MLFYKADDIHGISIIKYKQRGHQCSVSGTQKGGGGQGVGFQGLGASGPAAGLPVKLGALVMLRLPAVSKMGQGFATCGENSFTGPLFSLATTEASQPERPQGSIPHTTTKGGGCLVQQGGPSDSSRSCSSFQAYFRLTAKNRNGLNLRS